MSAQVPNGLEAGVEGGLSRRLADFVPRGARMHHLNGRIARFAGGFDLLRVVVGVANLESQGVVTNVSLDVHTIVDFHKVTFLEHHVAFPAFWWTDRVLGREVGGDVVHRDGAGKRRLAAVAVDEALSGLDDFVPCFSWLKFILHGLKRPTGHVTGITPVLHALLEVTHAITSASGTAPALITLTSEAPARSSSKRKVLPGPPGQRPGAAASRGRPS